MNSLFLWPTENFRGHNRRKISIKINIFCIYCRFSIKYTENIINHISLAQVNFAGGKNARNVQSFSFSPGSILPLPLRLLC